MGVRAPSQITVDGDVLRIDIGRGFVALADAADLPLLESRRWHASKNSCGRVRARAAKPAVFMHRLLVAPDDGLFVDHLNGDQLDNRRCNLRLATPQQNSTYRRRASNNTSGFIGIRRGTAEGSWRASIRVGGKPVALGFYPTKEEAARAYDAAARRLYGEFAALNFPEGRPLAGAREERTDG